MLRRELRPIENLPRSAPLAGHVGIDHQCFRPGKTMSIFYQIDPLFHAHRAHVGDAEFRAESGLFIALELQQAEGHFLQDRADLGGLRILEESHRCHVRRQRRSELLRARNGHESRAFAKEHAPDRVGAGLHGDSRVLRLLDAADLDARAFDHGNASRKTGRPNEESYSTPDRYKPSGMNVGAASRRSRAKMSSLIHPGECFPAPT